MPRTKLTKEMFFQMLEEARTVTKPSRKPVDRMKLDNLKNALAQRQGMNGQQPQGQVPQGPQGVQPEVK